jgi:two-component system chemotaxis sensor kinase CheA
MDVRMLPVSTAFARAPRLVRDLSRKLGKKVRLVQEGEDTAADKDVIEMLTEPLVHLVRNSLDHGIETPEQRAAAGKPEEATLLLRAAPDGDAVLVEIVDDGRGIDTDAVRRKAYERGLISEEALESLPDDEAAQLIFAPGFSTAEVISDVSGRGVGMDAVRSSIERLGGSVSMENHRGQSLTVRLRLPLTMAVSRVLLLTAGGQRFGVPLDDVVETVRVDRADVTRVAGHPVLALRDDVVPLVSLGRLLDSGSDLEADALNVLVVRTGTGPLGLVVDRFHQNTDVIMKPLEGFLAGTPGYCGTALLGDGLVLLVLDVKELNSRAAALR